MIIVRAHLIFSKVSDKSAFYIVDQPDLDKLAIATDAERNQVLGQNNGKVFKRNYLWLLRKGKFKSVAFHGFRGGFTACFQQPGKYSHYLESRGLLKCFHRCLDFTLVYSAKTFV